MMPPYSGLEISKYSDYEFKCLSGAKMDQGTTMYKSK